MNVKWYFYAKKIHDIKSKSDKFDIKIVSNLIRIKSDSNLPVHRDTMCTSCCKL